MARLEKLTLVTASTSGVGTERGQPSQPDATTALAQETFTWPRNQETGEVDERLEETS